MDISKLTLAPSKSTASTKIVYGSDDKLFGCIERNQRSSTLSSTSFGTFLDAGTGSHSLRWMASLLHPSAKTALSIDEFTAVTADEGMRQNVLKEAKSLEIDSKGSIVIGNWAERGKDELCKGQTFDTILCDYLVGAMDGFSPYYQDEIFPQLVEHLNPGGRIYVVGLNPVPDEAEGDANIICKATKVRDACILLAGHRCYREYPLEWIERHLERSGLEVVATSQFPILYSHNAIVRQLNVARSKLKLFPNQKLAKEMGETINFLEQESLKATSKAPAGRIKLGFDYVVTAQLPLKK
jgi:hypothetical protein